MNDRIGLTPVSSGEDNVIPFMCSKTSGDSISIFHNIFISRHDEIDDAYTIGKAYGWVFCCHSTRSVNAFLRARSGVVCFKKIAVFVILLLIDYSPLRCQKEQDSPQPRTMKC